MQGRNILLFRPCIAPYITECLTDIVVLNKECHFMEAVNEKDAAQALLLVNRITWKLKEWQFYQKWVVFSHEKAEQCVALKSFLCGKDGFASLPTHPRTIAPNLKLL